MSQERLTRMLDEVARRLRRAEVPQDALQLPDASALATEIQRRTYLESTAASRWLSPPEGGDAREWEQVLFEGIWSGAQDTAQDGLGAWLRSAVGAYLTLDEYPDVFVPVPEVSSSRGLGAFRLAQVGGVLARCFGDDSLVRWVANVVGPEEAFGAPVWSALQAVGNPEPGRGPLDPSVFAQAVFGPADGAGRTLSEARDDEVVTLTQALEYAGLQEQTGGGVRRELPYAACTFDYANYRLTAVTHGVTEPRFATIPPAWCRERLAAGEKTFSASVLTHTRRSAFTLAQRLIDGGGEL